MEITPHDITVRELVNGYENNEEDGVVGFGGLLNIRPKYQREFVYTENQQREVIYSIFKGYPLNVMYWVKNEDGSFELLDGQQRTLSICSFYEGRYFIKHNGREKGIENLSPEALNQFLDYKLRIYICENGTSDEKVEWFKIINIAGEKLTNQEMLNAVYAGPWITAVKKRFSKTNCLAYKLAKDYINGRTIRQDYLEKVLKWMSENNVESYMREHQFDTNSDAQWQHLDAVIGWVKRNFPHYRSQMKGVEWGYLYNKYKDTFFSASELENEIVQLMKDDDVENKSGIYPYLLTRQEKYLNIRAFKDGMKATAYERQNGICPHCHNHFESAEMEADHIIPWSRGGHTTLDNCQMLCRECNRRKSDN